MKNKPFKSIRVDFHITNFGSVNRIASMSLTEDEFIKWKPFLKWLSQLLPGSPKYNWYKSYNDIKVWSQSDDMYVVNGTLVRNIFRQRFQTDLPGECEKYVAKLVNDRMVTGDRLELITIYRMTKIEL